MKVKVIVIGDEILNGQVADTNTGEIARQLSAIGGTVSEVAVIGDDRGQIMAELRRALAEPDIDAVLTTGGLGPTKDDITKLVFCELTGSRMVENADALRNVRRVMALRNLEVNASTASQAMVPASCDPIMNKCGTAPGMWFEINGKVVCAMPGVPFETAAMLADPVVGRLRRRFAPEAAYARRTLLLTGIAESAVSERIAAWEDALPIQGPLAFHLAYLPNNGYLRLRIDGKGPDPDILEREADRLHAGLCAMLADHLFDTRDLTPAEILLDELKSRGLTFATAESCTGGKIASMLTAIPGSSAAVKGGVVAYCNSVKMNVLGVEAAMLDTMGAVSEPVAGQMALGAARVCGADVAVATSGIAGPTGATPGKPVGTVCSAVTFGGRTVTFTDHFPGNRQRVISRAANTVMIRAVRLLRGAGPGGVL